MEGASSVPSSSLKELRKLVESAKFIVVLTGAGISAESGIPTFRGEGGYWRGYNIEEIAMLETFNKDPSLVWELYHFRRENAFPKLPNAAHVALTEAQARLEKEGKALKILTQNIDELHTKAGSKDVIELHGSLFRTQCMECGNVAENYGSPICPALEGKGAKDKGTKSADIPPSQLPRCKRASCGGLLRPHIVWFDEDPTDEHMKITYEWLHKCDLMLIIGTTSIVPPAKDFGPYVAERGVPVAEFNLEHTPATKLFKFHVSGKCGETLPKVIGS